MLHKYSREGQTVGGKLTGEGGFRRVDYKHAEKIFHEFIIFDHFETSDDVGNK